MDNKKILKKLSRNPRVHGYISPLTETRRSPMHGLGLFAKKNIKKGTTVAVWGGKVTTTNELRVLPKKISYHYALELYPGFYLAERSASELDSSDFINHSCSPNCKIIDKFVMVTTQKILKGTELTADFSNHTRKGMSFMCNCKSLKCRKKIYFN